MQSHPLGAKIWPSEKVDFGCVKTHTPNLLLVDQSSPNLFTERGRNRCKSPSFPIVKRYLQTKSKVVQNLPEFGTFLGPDFFRWAHRILEPRIIPTSDHAAKFHNEWLTELGDLALKKKHQQ